MIQKIIPFIKDKKVILFGEIHGTKEIPKMLSEFFNETATNEDFNLCLEVPEEFQNVKLDRILPLAKEEGISGLMSEEYIKLIKKIPKKHQCLFYCPKINQKSRRNGKRNCRKHFKPN